MQIEIQNKCNRNLYQTQQSHTVSLEVQYISRLCLQVHVDMSKLPPSPIP